MDVCGVCGCVDVCINLSLTEGDLEQRNESK